MKLEKPRNEITSNNEETLWRISQLAARADRQKTRLLGKQGGGYTPVPHVVYRDILPELVGKYKKTEARDAVTLYMYLLAFVCGNKNDELYMWAYPSVKQINKATGIHGSRIAGLIDLLVNEGLMESNFVMWKGSRKKIYLPYYERGEIKEGADREGQVNRDYWRRPSKTKQERYEQGKSRLPDMYDGTGQGKIPF